MSTRSITATFCRLVIISYRFQSFSFSFGLFEANELVGDHQILPFNALKMLPRTNPVNYCTHVLCNHGNSAHRQTKETIRLSRIHYSLTFNLFFFFFSFLNWKSIPDIRHLLFQWFSSHFFVVVCVVFAGIAWRMEAPMNR